MLVLSRKKGERIVIGDGETKCEIVIVDILPHVARIGIDGKHVKAYRAELLTKDREAENAADDPRVDE